MHTIPGLLKRAAYLLENMHGILAKIRHVCRGKQVGVGWPQWDWRWPQIGVRLGSELLDCWSAEQGKYGQGEGRMRAGSELEWCVTMTVCVEANARSREAEKTDRQEAKSTIATRLPNQ